MTAPPDYAALASRFSRIQADMIHKEHSDLRGDVFYAEALRRLLDTPGSGFIAADYHEHVLDMNRGVDRASGEQAQRTLAELTSQYQRTMAQAAQKCADVIRSRARNIDSKYRREGALLAAEWLEAQTPPVRQGYEQVPCQP
jgi:N-formylglutamate amidohydrolase